MLSEISDTRKDRSLTRGIGATRTNRQPHMEDSKAGEGELGYESTERGTERRDKVAGDASLSDGKEGDGGAGGSSGEIVVPSDPLARAILRGFKIKKMTMRDAVKGILLWQCEEWDNSMFSEEQEAVSREITFSSEEMLDDFRLEQRVFFQGVCLEEWKFRFGFVIPGSTNTWQQTIEAAEDEQMLPADLISGKLTIESSFYDGDMLVSKSRVRVFYD